MLSIALEPMGVAQTALQWPSARLRRHLMSHPPLSLSAGYDFLLRVQLATRLIGITIPALTIGYNQTE